MKRIVIVGAGFAGLAALGRLSKAAVCADIVLIDKKRQSHFLPLLPDVIGGKIKSLRLTSSIVDLCKKYNCAFINEEVAEVCLEKKCVKIASRELSYDYLIIASGTETNFYGNISMKQHAYALDDACDALRVFSAIKHNNFKVYVVSGGGYTGIEVATNIKRHLKFIRSAKRVLVVEKGPSILGALPDWQKNYVYANLKALDIDILSNCFVEKFSGGTIFLSNKQSFERAMLIWVAGVKTADFIFKLNLSKTPQGRVFVDEHLRAHPDCFIAGDAAAIVHDKMPLRMAVQFAIAEGRLAAENILNCISGKPLKKYKPFDFGYLVPMANNRACGIVLGQRTHGELAMALHYSMCIFRSYGFRNKIGILRDLLGVHSYDNS